MTRFTPEIQAETHGWNICTGRLGTRHLDHLLSEYIDYFNHQRPHSSLDFATPTGQKPPVRAGPTNPREVRCKERLGGVIKHYYRKAA